MQTTFFIYFDVDGVHLGLLPALVGGRCADICCVMGEKRVFRKLLVITNPSYEIDSRWLHENFILLPPTTLRRLICCPVARVNAFFHGMRQGYLRKPLMTRSESDRRIWPDELFDHTGLH